jgi:hypothetical protein
MLKPLRYVVLHHTGYGTPHYDLMFEENEGSELLTWRSAVWPIEAQTPLTRLSGHRRHYLDYEGPISGDRGIVTQVQAGLYDAYPQWDDPYVIDVWIKTPAKAHLWLFCPPTYEWMIQPAR